MGTATLVGGTIAVANTSVTANTRIFISRSTTGGTEGTALDHADRIHELYGELDQRFTTQAQ
jgi:hypothetical protein